MSTDLSQISDRFQRWVWGSDLGALSRTQAAGIRLIQIVWVFVGDFATGNLSLRAMSLVYTTLLSLVPLLAFTFSVLAGFGVHNQLEPVLLNFLAPLGEQGVEIAQKLIGFVENVKVGVLGSIGLALLIYTVISLLSKIEESFNFIWHVEQPRRLGQRFSEYLSVLLIGPVLVFSALGITATLLNASAVQELATIQPFGFLIKSVAKLLPYVLVIGAFTFVYIFMPNTRVRFLPALVGGMVAGVLWQTVGWGFSAVVVGSTKYTAIYSSFAILILFLIWLFVSWLILLFGAGVAFYAQHPENLIPSRGRMDLSNRVRRRAVLLAMYRVGERFYRRKAPPTGEDLTRWLDLPMDATQWVLATLERQGLIKETCGDTPAYVPACDLDQLPVRELLRAALSSGASDRLGNLRLPAVPAIDMVLQDLDRAMEETVGDRTLRDLILQEGPGRGGEPTPVPEAPAAEAVPAREPADLTAERSN